MSGCEISVGMSGCEINVRVSGCNIMMLEFTIVPRSREYLLSHSIVTMVVTCSISKCSLISLTTINTRGVV